ncbi:MAG: amidase [Verrucomicrobia bacterium]|nr:amidase [Verrucomicrobiota bacterium]
MPHSNISVSASRAFVEVFELPPTGSGPLDGMRFAIKDLIDVAGWKTGSGNPSWCDSHPPAVVHAVCVEQMLKAGATGVGKTVTDELAFGLLGHNDFLGTPLNPRAPDRLPGGSSSGSASAVACGLADFALGTDTGGSVRVPASNCGIHGFRPSHGFVSVAGVNPLAPGFDTVGILAADADVLARVAVCLLACGPAPQAEPASVRLVLEAFELCDPEVREALGGAVRRLRECFGSRVAEVSLRDVVGDEAGGEMAAWRETYCVLQWAEIKSSLGAWIAAARPAFGAATAASFALTDQLDRGRVAEAVGRRESWFRRLRRALGPADMLCLPSVPALPPLRDDPLPVRSPGSGGASSYYPRTLALTSIAGIGRLPQVSLPMGQVGGVPVGLSLVAGHGQDAFLLEVARRLNS